MTGHRLCIVPVLALLAAGCSDPGAGPTGGGDVRGPDGTSYATLAEAVAAAAPASVITVGEGDFTGRLEITKPLTLRGAGPGTRLSARSRSDRPSDDSAILVIRNTSGLRLENLTVDGGPDNGVLVRDSENIELVNVASTGHAEHGLVVRGSRGVVVQGGRFSDNGDDGIRVRDGAADITVNGAEAAGNAGSGIRVRDSSGVSLAGNTASGNGEWGIRVENSGVVNGGTLASDNVLDGNTRGALRVE